MKISINIEVDLNTGIYDVTFNNLTNPDYTLDLQKLVTIGTKVLNNVASNHGVPALEPFAILRTISNNN